MQCTPESNLRLESCKGPKSYDNSSDSGYSGLFHSPHSGGGADSCRSLSPGESDETSKENLRLSVTPKERTREPLGFLAKDYRGRQRPPMASWYETPKRDSSLRHRLLMCRPNQAVKPDKTRETESSTGASSEHWLSVSFDSFDAVTGALASSTLNPDQEQPLSGRERRLLFTQVRTSTLEDGKLDSGQLSSCGRRISLSDADFIENMSASDQIHIETPTFSKFLPTTKGSFHSPISGVTTNLYDSSSVLCTPSSTPTHKYIRYVLC